MGHLAVGRRRFLAGLVASSPLFLSGCQGLEGVLNSATPTPTHARLARIAWPDTHVPGSFNFWRDLPLGTQSYIPSERHLDLEMLAVDLGSTPDDQLADRYATLIGGLERDQAPDLVLLPSWFATGLAKGSVLQDLAPLLKGERWYRAGDFRGNVLQVGTKRGKLVALPLMVSAELVMYDRGAFERAGVPLPQAGWTWEDCIAAARRLTRPRREGEAPYWGFFASPWGPSLFTLAWQQGAELIGPKGGLDVTEPGTVKALELLVSFSREHKVAPPMAEVPTPGDTWSVWEAQHAAMWPRVLPSCGLSWWRGATNVALAEMPRAERKVSAGNVDLMLGIPRNAPDVGHSLNILRSVIEASDKAMLLPPRTTAGEVSQIAPELRQGDAAALGAALDSARFVPGDFEPNQAVWEIWQNELLGPILSGQKQPEQACRDAQKRLDEVQALERSGW